MADSDLDEELLLAAGGGSRSTKKRGRGRQQASSDDDEFSDGLDNRKTQASDKKKPAVPLKKRRTDASDEEEDADDGDDGGDEDEFDDGYGSDLMGDEEDRAKLAEMTALEREMELFMRSERRDRERERKALLKQQREKDKKGATRSSSRRTKAKQETHSSIKKLAAAHQRKAAGGLGRYKETDDEVGAKAQAEEGAEEEDQKSSRRGKKSDADSLFGSDDEEEEPKAGGKARGEDEDDDYRPDADKDAGAQKDAGSKGEDHEEEEEEEEDDEEVDRRRVSHSEKKEKEKRWDPELDAGDDEEDELMEDAHSGDEEEGAEEASLEEVGRVQVKRSQLEGWCQIPIFSECLKDAVVRVSLAPLGGSNQGPARTYMMQIIEVVSDDVRPQYQLGRHMVNKYLKVTNGENERTVSCAVVSNQAISSSELETFLRLCQDNGLRDMVTKQTVQDVTANLDRLSKYRITAEDVKRAVEEKSKSRRQAPASTHLKVRLQRLLDKARSDGNQDEIEQLETQLREVEEALRQALASRASGAHALNARNQQHNIEMLLKGNANKADAKLAEAYARNPTRLNIYWRTGNKDDKEAEAARLKQLLEQSKPVKLNKNQQHMDPVKLLSALDIDIDVSLAQHYTTGPLLAKRLLPARWQESVTPPGDLSSKNVLTLADWKRRAGMIM